MIVLNLMVPEMDGFKFLEQIRQQANPTEHSVIVVTAKDLTSEDLERLNGGVQRIIQNGQHGIESILNEIRRYLH